LWAKGYFKETDYPEWILCDTKAPLENGDTGYEVLRDDFPTYINIPNSQAIWFWHRTKKYGMPPDWRKLTVQQLAVLDLFNSLWAIHEKKQEDLAELEAKAKAQRV
jgi:hypothetical protein